MPTLHQLVADKIESDPSCIGRAYATLDRWEIMGHCPPRRCEEWRVVLKKAEEGKDGLQSLLGVLRGDSESNRRMRDFSPFAGLLSREERRKAFLTCAYDH